ncbi:PREDICTED: putative nuclease HARBI1 [Trachymyrmex cornetzi]|uniref:putative nuclease HARBI1 n=1 Tax=Trachymyrmex cornetzi TaxID=471704 RepID=UPI00084F6897|nr:PREDICTED: putative nuclease HARBI1 [Trachymyrmex cornetzi]
MTERIMKMEKDRRGSTGELAMFMKRKREGEGGESEDRKMEETFRRSKKTLRSPVKIGEGGEMKEILEELKELKEMRVEMREGLKGMSKEIRAEEVAEGQKEWMRKEMEKVKEELRVKEEKWQREKGEMLERLKELEGELGKMKMNRLDIFELIETLSSSTDESNKEDEDVLLFPLMHYLMNDRRRHRIENYIVIVNSWTDEEFKEHLRLTRYTATILIEELELSGYIPSHSFSVKPISAKLSLLLFLWYIANTEPLRTMSDRFNISISSVFRVLRRVVAWFLTKLDAVIKWSQDREIMTTCEKFSMKRGIKNVLGAIDSTHIQIIKPTCNARNYCNRKKFFSINLQAIVDADMCFTNIYCGEPGSLHDARVFRRSLLYEMVIQDKNLLFPNQTFLLGDSAYPCLSWLIPPFRDNGHLTPRQTEFNFMHSSIRIIVEKAFGQLKGHFRRIKFFTEYRDITFVTNTVIAACVLHNYCIDKNDVYDFPEYNDINNINIYNDELNIPNCEVQGDRLSAEIDVEVEESKLDFEVKSFTDEVEGFFDEIVDEVEDFFDEIVDTAEGCDIK